MQIIGSVVSCLIIFYVRSWLLSTVFGPRALKKQLLIKILVMGILMVSILFAYTYVTSLPNYSSRSVVAHLTMENGLAFIGYCIVGVWLIFLFFRKRALQILEIIGIWALLFIGIHFGGIFLWLNSMILYYLISAYAEEYMKYSGSTIVFREHESIPSSLIFFCVLMGLGFSLVENVVYLATVLLHHQDVNLAAFVLGRWLISALVHVTATSAIWYLSIKLPKSMKLFMITIIWLISWVLLHTTYNLSLYYSLSYISIPLVIGLFFLMSFFLFQSDILYLPTDRDPKRSTTK